ncbi:hypothetical protein ARALYDRAFT_916186 [Arabidopsis lyrata subsp. lyrata]|uniref:Uncharacterized protein n=1 Tax=Arabidopsis lyrata subsp. lyrata TaxID=81972 RepID=D7MJ70_ARALL|nr:hypothetical protein ARALYDRAFT_916186 [Arabidopsis lyrata subsp. lyrata]
MVCENVQCVVPATCCAIDHFVRRHYSTLLPQGSENTLTDDVLRVQAIDILIG